MSDIYFKLACSYSFAGDLDNALENYLMSFKLDQSNADCCINIGYALSMKGQEEEAF